MLGGKGKDEYFCIYVIGTEGTRSKNNRDMRYTLEFARERFAHFNKTIFNDRLPRPAFWLVNVNSYMGQMHRTLKRDKQGYVAMYKMKLNVKYDIDERKAEDIMLHEMIHLYIWHEQLKDASSHGPVFKSVMEKINKEFGRHITISTKMKREVTMVVRMKWNLVAVCRMTSGKTAITLPPSTRVAHFQKVLMESDKVSSIEWYYTTDAFFYNYPHPLTVKLYYVDEALLAQHLKEDERIRQTAGK